MADFQHILMYKEKPVGRVSISAIYLKRLLNLHIIRIDKTSI